MNALRFEPFTSIVSPSFWSLLAKEKLNSLGLDDREIPIYGHYQSGATARAARFFITEECLLERSSQTQSSM